MMPGSTVVIVLSLIVAVHSQVGSFKRCQTSTCPGPFTCYDVNGAEICIHSNPICPAPQFTQTRCQSSCMADQQCMTPTSLPGTKCCNLGPCQACVNPNFFLRSKVKVITGTGFPNTGNPNTGFPNTGFPNTGNPNTGFPNTGNPNTGFPNTGYPNTGVPNTGIPPNTGFPNTGIPNTGVPNTGFPNIGYPNSGSPNTGIPNTGVPNTGFPNTGYPNTGTPNTGIPNTGVPNTGFPNTGIPNTGVPNTGFPNTGYPNSGFPNSNTGYPNLGTASTGLSNPAPLADEQPQHLGSTAAAAQEDEATIQDNSKAVIPGAGLHSGDAVANTASSDDQVTFGAIIGANLNNPIATSSQSGPVQLPANNQGGPVQLPANQQGDPAQLPANQQGGPVQLPANLPGDDLGAMLAHKAVNVKPDLQ